MRVFKKIEGEKGIALIMALWIMTILLVVAASFSFMMRTEVKMARNYRNGMKAHYLALAGVNHAIAVLLNDTNNIDHYGEDWFHTFAEPLEGDTMDEMYRKVRWRPQVKYLGGLTYVVHLSDENSKCNLNYAAAGGIVHLVCPDYEFDDPVACRKACYLLDYRDGAQLMPPFTAYWGPAVMTYYSGSVGYEGAGVKNNFLDTVYEIQKVKDINLGAGGVYDNPLDTLWVDPADHAQGKWRGDESDMTVYSQDYNTTIDGNARVDVNNTDAAALAAATGLSISDCAEILSKVPYLEYGYPLKSEDLVQVPKMGIGALCTQNAGIDETKMRNIADVIKVIEAGGTGAGIIKGTVNINTATLYGLRGLYGIGVATAPNIIESRVVEGPFYQRGEVLRYLGPGLSPVIDDNFQSCAETITVRSDRFRIYSTGIVTGTDAARRKIEAVIDRGYHKDQVPGPIEILYWSEKVFAD